MICNKYKTPYCNNFCECTDWTDPELLTEYLYMNMNICADALTYVSIDTLTYNQPILCALGICDKCGKQVCLGGELYNVDTFDALMRRLLREVTCYDSNDELVREAAAVQLLHEEDQELALDWLYEMGINTDIYNLTADFTDNFKHVPGYSFEVMKNLYMGLYLKNPDTSLISDLSRANPEWLKDQCAARVQREKGIVQEIVKYTHIWDSYALETRAFSDALDVAVAERPAHTGNQWNEYDDGRVRIHEISNAVYKMRILAESPGPDDIRQFGSVQWELTVNALPHNAEILGKRVIKKGRKIKLYLEEDADLCVAERKHAFAEYFEVIFPPVPKDLLEHFEINGILLPEYTALKD